MGLAVAFNRPHRQLFSRQTWTERSEPHEHTLLKILSSQTRKYLLSVLNKPSSDLFTFIEKKAQNVDDKFWQDFEVEYNRLFVGPYSPEAYPNESSYRNPYQQMLDECVFRICEAYSQEGFIVRHDFHDRPDHIVAELEFMAILCERELQARQNNNKEKTLEYLLKEYDFLMEHLGRWTSEFSHKIKASTDSQFYLSLATILRDFVSEDLENLRDEIFKQEARALNSKVNSRYVKDWIPPPAGSFNEERVGYIVEINPHDCILCGVCVSRCPTEALRITSDQQSIRLFFKAALCSGCQQCFTECPQQAIKLSPRYEHQKADMEGKWVEILSTKAIRCSGCGKVYSPDKMQQRVLASFTKYEYKKALTEMLSLCTKCKRERLAEQRV